jgi:hypothetical protein
MVIVLLPVGVEEAVYIVAVELQLGLQEAGLNEQYVPVGGLGQEKLTD